VVAREPMTAGPSIEKLVDGLVIGIFPFGAYSLTDLLLEPSGDLLGRPAQLQLLKDKAQQGGTAASEILDGFGQAAWPSPEW
jgi:hypothetical protein